MRQLEESDFQYLVCSMGPKRDMANLLCLNMMTGERRSFDTHPSFYKNYREAQDWVSEQIGKNLWEEA